MRLFCFPHAGGTGTLYRSWAAPLAFRAEVRVVSCEAAGELTEMARSCADRLADVADGAMFFGHSMGALVAFETIRLLRRAGRRGPGLLFASGHVAPHLPSPGRELHALPRAEFWAEVRRLGGTPDELAEDAELRLAVEDRLRAEFRAAETYRYTAGQPLDCDVVALAGTEDERAPADGVAAWRLHTTGGFAVHEFTGGHFFLTERTAAVLDLIDRAGGPR